MKKEIELIRYVRTNIIKLVDALTDEQLNTIPEKFNNNIAWNMAHLIVTQQYMHYKLGGFETHIDENWFGRFIPGTQPDGIMSAEEIAMVKNKFKTTIDQLEKDIEDQKLDAYKAWTIPGGMDVSSLDDVLKISCVHEGRHYGVIISLVKLVK